MAKRAMMYCPQCRAINPAVKSELFTEMPEQDVFRCLTGHAFPNYMALMEMRPDLIRLEHQEKPQPNQVKVEFWIDQQILNRFQATYPNRQSATVESILGCYIYGEPIIIDGNQAKELQKLGVRTGQEMLVALQTAKTMESDLNTAQEKLAMLQGMFANAGVQSPV